MLAQMRMLYSMGPNPNRRTTWGRSGMNLRHPGNHDAGCGTAWPLPAIGHPFVGELDPAAVKQWHTMSPPTNTGRYSLRYRPATRLAGGPASAGQATRKPTLYTR